MKTTTVPCAFCDGTGKVPLTGVHFETLQLLRKNPGLSGAELGRLDGCTGMAMCNRLRALERHGVAKCETWGRERKWVAV